MIQVFMLYRGPDPEGDPRAEYYSLSLSTKETFQTRPIFIRKSHGFWNEAEKRPIASVRTFGPDEGFDDPKEAEIEFERHLRHRAKVGFIHCFHCFSKPSPFEPMIHRILQPD
jgi:hypothetical protein